LTPWKFDAIIFVCPARNRDGLSILSRNSKQYRKTSGNSSPAEAIQNSGCLGMILVGQKFPGKNDFSSTGG
jgi:hypothetical protein